MPGTQPSDRPNIFPCLRYEDAPAAIEWLVRAFGFEKHLVVPNPDGTIAHAELKLGPGVVMLGSAREDHFGMKTPRKLGGVTQSDLHCPYRRGRPLSTGQGRRRRDRDGTARHRLRLARVRCQGPRGQPLELRHLHAGR